jgi:hypothetical protein
LGYPWSYQYVFYNVPTDIPVYIPCNTYDAYSQERGWDHFTNLIEDCNHVEEHCNAALQIYPNPTNGELRIGYAISDDVISDIVIYDVSGRAQKTAHRKSEIGKSEIEIDVSHLPNGVYFLRAGNRTAKFVKN